MRFGLMTAAACMAAMLGTATAEAGPMNVAPMSTAPATGTAAPAQSQLNNAVYTGSGAKLILVGRGCGFGAHRTFRGCRLNRGFRGRIRARHMWRHHRRYY